MGPGPSNVHPRVSQSAGAPMLGHLDAYFLRVMDEVREMLRVVFQTRNALTLPISGTGTAGMEAVLVNLIEPGDTIVVAINGFFGERLADIATRCGANVARVQYPWGAPVDPDPLKLELRNHRKIKAIALVHAETSTGVLTPLPELATLAHEHDALIVADTVTSLGGVDLRIDEWNVDASYSGTQKCLACPPGLAPVTFSKQAEEIINHRTYPVQSFYLDLTELRKYWQERAYHHTAPISMIYGLHEGLRLVIEEGLQNRFARHQKCSDALHAGLEAMGLTLFAQNLYRLPSLTSVCVPKSIDEKQVRKTLLSDFAIEIGGGLGEQTGQIWRIGLMGENARPDRVLYFLSSLELTLRSLGFDQPVGNGAAAAQQILSQHT